MGPRAGLYAMEKRKYICSCQESNSDRPARSLVITLAELSRLHQMSKGSICFRIMWEWEQARGSNL